jgi:hypothetical protein
MVIVLCNSSARAQAQFGSVSLVESAQSLTEEELTCATLVDAHGSRAALSTLNHPLPENRRSRVLIAHVLHAAEQIALKTEPVVQFQLGVGGSKALECEVDLRAEGTAVTICSVIAAATAPIVLATA